MKNYCNSIELIYPMSFSFTDKTGKEHLFTTTSKIKYITSMVGIPINDVVLFVDGVYMTSSRD